MTRFCTPASITRICCIRVCKRSPPLWLQSLQKQVLLFGGRYMSCTLPISISCIAGWTGEINAREHGFYGQQLGLDRSMRRLKPGWGKGQGWAQGTIGTRGRRPWACAIKCNGTWATRASRVQPWTSKDMRCWGQGTEVHKPLIYTYPQHMLYLWRYDVTVKTFHTWINQLALAHIKAKGFDSCEFADERQKYSGVLRSYMSEWRLSTLKSFDLQHLCERNRR